MLKRVAQRKASQLI